MSARTNAFHLFVSSREYMFKCYSIECVYTHTCIECVLDLVHYISIMYIIDATGSAIGLARARAAGGRRARPALAVATECSELMMLLLSLLLSSGGAHGALTTKELAAGQPSFLFILVSAATEPRGPCAGTERVQRV